MNIIITSLIVLSISYIGILIAKKLRISSVIVLILIGLLVSVPLIKNVIIEPNTQTILTLGDIGLLALMFIAGLETSWRSLYKERRDAVFIASFTAFVPFILGFAVFCLMGFSLIISVVVGICMSVTAEATRARVLLEIRKLKTRVGAGMMGAGIIDDIFGLGMFMLITSLFRVISINEELLIAGAIMMFFIGVLAQGDLGRNHKMVKFLERGLLIFIVPFFFISIGLHFDFSSVLIDWMLLVILTIAISGKLIGSFLTKPFLSFNWKQLHLIGWAMNSRGAVELALALIAFKSGLIPVNLYSGLIVMAIVSTIVFPFIITNMVKKYPDVME